ncbi:NADP-dependent oxidoreductase domain-containing protein [Microdochium trichocladiopsis]|uniref:NADP-dependent oxidoreductase domain-containing protein n=1 Tax=Microdochium trichocladiopsis TaxID=1682393 RepID=A0A9P8YJD3_9PEZI|nr:NADP-dependent oxidoreductase domain-containing protein [Microdochium trichocladiopsis]KAH7040486.1 NADP-dependent oxidoreductase domain-containing protein [Microdochium trichocladiopsis]
MLLLHATPTSSISFSRCCLRLQGASKHKPSSLVSSAWATNTALSRTSPRGHKPSPSSSASFASITTTTTTMAQSTSPTASKPGLTQHLTLPDHHHEQTTTPTTTTTTPRLVYGTAWKATQTASLVHAALRAGFRGIDTANQPRHYSEGLVGRGIAWALADGTIKSRAELFVQTKFTGPQGQDRPVEQGGKGCPYYHEDPLETQVRSSVEGSFVNLFGKDSSSSSSDDDDSGGGGGGAAEGTDIEVEAGATAAAAPAAATTYIDSLVLHSPMPTYSETFAVWKVLESYVPHRIRHLGIANAPLEVVERLYHETTTTTTEGAGAGLSVPPSVVQNRFYAPTGYDADLRRFCRERGIVYQSFWTLTANNADNRMRGKVDLVGSKPVAKLAAAFKNGEVSREVAYYSLVLGLEGITILDGTTSEVHMREDLDGVDAVGRFAASEEGRVVWEECLAEFKALIGEDDEF